MIVLLIISALLAHAIYLILRDIREHEPPPKLFSTGVSSDTNKRMHKVVLNERCSGFTDVRDIPVVPHRASPEYIFRCNCYTRRREVWVSDND